MMAQIELRVWLIILLLLQLLLLSFFLQVRKLVLSGLKTGPTFLTDTTLR